MTHPRLISYYLPQYHPIPENDRWWGEGFTEWTNVRKARPLFRGHLQPKAPGALGYYDLRDAETRAAQAELAQNAGIEGFCYWHYWFAGKQLLERPLREVLSSGEPEFPFCLGWANQSWTGIWHGNSDDMLMEQTYPGVEDHTAHFYALLSALSDPRYLKVDGRPLLLIYQPSDLTSQWVELWQKLARQTGLGQLFLLGVVKNEQEAEGISRMGFDACTISRIQGRGNRLKGMRHWVGQMLGAKLAAFLYQQMLKQPFQVYDYDQVLPYVDLRVPPDMSYFPCVIPNWDNTPRSGVNGYVFVNQTANRFQDHLHQAIERVSISPPDRQIVILKSWNEWAEGNYLEPDAEQGDAYLRAIQQEVALWNQQ